MREGLWENLGFRPMPGFHWRSLKFCACGDTTLDVETLRKVTEVRLDPAQTAIFWRVLEAFTPDERTALMKFSTGTPRLPPGAVEAKLNCLIVDGNDAVDTLPTSSTCFFKLHVPRYTSYDKAYACIRMAVLYTGTFAEDGR
jgi:hypothetical protein